jgi:hypothetical protein
MKAFTRTAELAGGHRHEPRRQLRHRLAPNAYRVAARMSAARFVMMIGGMVTVTAGVAAA